jgi:hypothetical protein
MIARRLSLTALALAVALGDILTWAYIESACRGKEAYNHALWTGVCEHGQRWLPLAGAIAAASAVAVVWVGARRFWLLLTAAALLGAFPWLWYGDFGENFGPLLPGR